MAEGGRRTGGAAAGQPKGNIYLVNVLPIILTQQLVLVPIPVPVLVVVQNHALVNTRI